MTIENVELLILISYMQLFSVIKNQIKILQGNIFFNQEKLYMKIQKNRFSIVFPVSGYGYIDCKFYNFP